jgi:hypothetical protein
VAIVAELIGARHAQPEPATGAGAAAVPAAVDHSCCAHAVDG